MKVFLKVFFSKIIDKFRPSRNEGFLQQNFEFSHKEDFQKLMIEFNKNRYCNVLEKDTLIYQKQKLVIDTEYLNSNIANTEFSDFDLVISTLDAETQTAISFPGDSIFDPWVWLPFIYGDHSFVSIIVDFFS